MVRPVDEFDNNQSELFFQKLESKETTVYLDFSFQKCSDKVAQEMKLLNYTTFAVFFFKLNFSETLSSDRKSVIWNICLLIDLYLSPQSGSS